MSEKAWENYWSSGLQSCFPKNSTADKQLELTWRKAINQIEIPGNACLLELGCGNGFLTSIIIDTLADKNFTLNVMDYSKVQLNDLLIKKNNKVNIVHETSIELMPYESSSINVLFSNFAFEYAETSKAIKQTARVLKPGGCFLYNVHSNCSLVSDVSTSIYDALEKIQENKELYNNIFQIISLKLARKEEKNKDSILKLAKQIIDELKNIDVLSNGGIASSGVVEDILPFINISNERVSLSQLEATWENYRYYKIRIKQQMDVGFDADSMNTLISKFIEEGIEIKVEPVLIENKVFSYMLHGIKNNV